MEFNEIFVGIPRALPQTYQEFVHPL